MELVRLPVVSHLQSIERRSGYALKAYQHLGAATVTEQLKQLRILGNRHIRFRKPADFPILQLRKQLLPIVLVYKTVVVGKLDKRMVP